MTSTDTEHETAIRYAVLALVSDHGWTAADVTTLVNDTLADAEPTPKRKSKPLPAALVRMHAILDRLDVEEDERERYDLIDEAIGLADVNAAAAAAWKGYR